MGRVRAQLRLEVRLAAERAAAAALCEVSGLDAHELMRRLLGARVQRFTPCSSPRRRPQSFRARYADNELTAQSTRTALVTEPLFACVGLASAGVLPPAAPPRSREAVYEVLVRLAHRLTNQRVLRRLVVPRNGAPLEAPVQPGGALTRCEALAAFQHHSARSWWSRAAFRTALRGAEADALLLRRLVRCAAATDEPLVRMPPSPSTSESSGSAALESQSSSSSASSR